MFGYVPLSNMVGNGDIVYFAARLTGEHAETCTTYIIVMKERHIYICVNEGAVLDFPGRDIHIPSGG